MWATPSRDRTHTSRDQWSEAAPPEVVPLMSSPTEDRAQPLPEQVALPTTTISYNKFYKNTCLVWLLILTMNIVRILKCQSAIAFISNSQNMIWRIFQSKLVAIISSLKQFTKIYYHIIRSKYCKSMTNTNWDIENPIIDFSPVSAAVVLK